MASKKKKGFTLLELIITVAILLIVISVVSPFFITNYITLNRSQDNMDLQSEGDRVLENLSINAMKSSGIYSMEYDDGTLVPLSSTKTEVSIRKLQYYIKDMGSGTRYLPQVSFDLKASNPGSLVDYVKVSPLPSGVAFQNAEGIYVKIGLTKRKESKSLESEIFFRNK